MGQRFFLVLGKLDAERRRSLTTLATAAKLELANVENTIAALAWLERHGHRGRRIDAGRVTSLRKALGHRIPPAPFRERARDELRRGMVRVVDRLRGDTRTDSPREVAIHAATARAL